MISLKFITQLKMYKKSISIVKVDSMIIVHVICNTLILHVLHVNGMIIILYINIQKNDNLIDEKCNDKSNYLTYPGLHYSILPSLQNHPPYRK